VAEENKNEDFDESFEGDFDFLEEDEAKTNTSEPTQTKEVEGPIYLRKKSIFIVGIIVIGIIAFSTIYKKTPPSSPIEAKEQAAKRAAKSEQITVQLQAKNAESTTNTTPSGTENTKNSAIIVDSNLATPTTIEAAADPELAKLKNASGDEKTREEMADLFATTDAEQTNNLATALAKQTKEQGPNQSNMELYFGNANANKSDKKAPPKIEDVSQQTVQLQQSVESITQEITENVNQIKQLETKLNDLSSVLTKINQNLGSMDARMLGLTEAVDSITQDVSNVKKVIAEEDLDIASSSTKTTTDTQLTYKPPGYSIHAIIPGRAWLKSSSGQIITIAEGDVVGDYGTVAVIDAANNIVRTSSGVTFR
jgi:hypothetical protein